MNPLNFLKKLNQNNRDDNLFNPLEIHEAAALAYWFNIYNGCERGTFGLPDVENARNILSHYTERLPKDLVKPFEDAVFDEIKSKVFGNDLQLNGTFFVEDIPSGLTPNSSKLLQKFNVAQDSDKLQNYQFTNLDKMPSEGKLVLRTPLPSTVVVKELGISFMRVKDSSALGFEKTMFFNFESYSELPQNSSGFNYALTGTFYIPSTESYADQWIKLIPNSSIFTDKMTSFVGAGMIDIQVHR